jgi:hypothetical protein
MTNCVAASLATVAHLAATRSGKARIAIADALLRAGFDAKCPSLTVRSTHRYLDRHTWREISLANSFMALRLHCSQVGGLGLRPLMSKTHLESVSFANGRRC